MLAWCQLLDVMCTPKPPCCMPLQVVEVDCVLYDDQTIIKAFTLQGAPASMHLEDRKVQPSARYLRLLQDGQLCPESFLCWFQASAT